MANCNAVITATVLLATTWAGAEPYAGRLKLSGENATKEAAIVNEATAAINAVPFAPQTPRPTLASAAGQKLTANFTFLNASKRTFTDVLIHFYVVRIDRPGQAAPPLEPKDVVIESAQTMDFVPGGQTTATLTFTPDRAGVYLVRLETPAVPDERVAVHSASLELVVK